MNKMVFKILEIRELRRMIPERHKTHEKSPAIALVCYLERGSDLVQEGGAQEEPSGLPGLRTWS